MMYFAPPPASLACCKTPFGNVWPFPHCFLEWGCWVSVEVFLLPSPTSTSSSWSCPENFHLCGIFCLFLILASFVSVKPRFLGPHFALFWCSVRSPSLRTLISRSHTLVFATEALYSIFLFDGLFFPAEGSVPLGFSLDAANLPETEIVPLSSLLSSHPTPSLRIFSSSAGLEVQIGTPMTSNGAFCLSFLRYCPTWVFGRVRLLPLGNFTKVLVFTSRNRISSRFGTFSVVLFFLVFFSFFFFFFFFLCPPFTFSHSRISLRPSVPFGLKNTPSRCDVSVAAFGRESVCGVFLLYFMLFLLPLSLSFPYRELRFLITLIFCASLPRSGQAVLGPHFPGMPLSDPSFFP